MRTVLVAGVLALVLVVAGACGDDDEGSGGGGGEGATGGAAVFSENCATCHGQDGEGGYGPELGGGAVAEAFPDIEDQIAVITNGRANMPAFEGELTDEQIRSVAEFEREELGQ
jgi:mono/diheme cytochrome c family protein